MFLLILVTGCVIYTNSISPLMNTNFLKSKTFFFWNSSSFIYLFIYLWLCWVFVSVRGLSLIVASGDHSSSRCTGLSLSRPLLLQSTGSRRAGSVVVAHGPSCSVACGIFPDQGSNPCPLHWQADSQPLRHQGSPKTCCIWLFCSQVKRICLSGNLSYIYSKMLLALQKILERLVLKQI